MKKKVIKKKSPIKLLEESIKYWEKEHQKMSDDYTPTHDIYTCPLCVEYYNEDFGRYGGSIVPGKEAYSYKSELLIKPY